MKKLILGLGLVVLSLQGHAAKNVFGRKLFAPENSMRISVHSLTAAMDQATFNAVVDHFEEVYGPIVGGSFGTKLVVRREWTSDVVNAYAEEDDGNFNIEIHGGLARHPETTPDALANVLCHEMGHHIGGAPKISFERWASNEGQSDFFANTKCMRKYFERDNNQAIVAKMAIPEIVKKDCALSFPSNEDQAICQRSAMSGLALAKLLHSLGGDGAVPAFDTPDLSKVSRTNDNHPEAQCRLDTYYAGALCEISHLENPVQTSERASFCMNDTHARGFRPACWYKEGSSRLDNN